MERKRNVFDDIITGLQEALEFEQGKRALRCKSVLTSILTKKDTKGLKKRKQGEKL